MKRSITILMLLALTLSLCACGEKPAGGADASANATAPAETAVPAPTEEPDATPEPEVTAEPVVTPEPTATPEPVEIDFESCAEAVAHLPWGEGEHEVHFDPQWVDADDQPGCLYVTEGRIYVLDRFYSDDTGIIVYDTATGEISRLNVFGTKYGVHTEFAIEGNELITPFMIYDTETGEETLLQPPPIESDVYECVRKLHKADGEWYLYISEQRVNEAYSTPNMNPLTREYKLDRENRLWKSVRMFVHNRQYNHIQLCDGLSYRGVLDRGTVNGEDQYVDYDGSGRHYVVTMDYRATEEGSKSYLVLTRYSPEGVRLCYTELFLDPISYRNNASYWYHYVHVDEDGTVWFMMMYDYEVTIYKLHLDN